MLKRHLLEAILKAPISSYTAASPLPDLCCLPRVPVCRTRSFTRKQTQTTRDKNWLRKKKEIDRDAFYSDASFCGLVRPDDASDGSTKP